MLERSVPVSIRLERIPNRRGRACFLLRQSWREGARIRKKTLANPAGLSAGRIAGIDAVLGGGVAFRSLGEAVSIRRSLPHGAVAAVPGTARGLGLERILHRRRSRMRDPALAAIVSRVISPDSRPATARQLSPASAASSPGSLLGLGEVSGGEMPEMLDWLLKRQRRIEGSLAGRHLTGGTLILHDVSSSRFEGNCCKLAAFGPGRDGRKGRKQIVYGMPCSEDGCPVAVEVLAGNTADPATVAGQVKKIRGRFGIGKVALVGDRGMLTTARIGEDVEPSGLDRIPALGTGDIRRLPTGAPPPPVPEEPVDDAVAGITGPEHPGERLMVCLNPRLGEERRRRREALLMATGEIPAGIAAAHAKGRPGPANRDRTWKAIGRKVGRRKVERHFDVTVTDDGMAGCAARRGPSPRHGSTASTSCGPASGPRPSAPRRRSRHASPSPGWSGASATPNPIPASVPSMSMPPIMCGDMCSRACRPCMPAGRCEGGWRLSCSRMMIGRVPGCSGAHRWRRPGSRMLPGPGLAANAPLMVCRCTVSIH